MTTGPGEMEGDLGRLRASDADRERVIEGLKTAFVQGRLTHDELGTRWSQVLVSRTYAELALITADLPIRLADPRSLPEPVRARAGKPVNRKLVVLAALVVISPALGAAFLTFYGGFIILFLLAFTGLMVTSGP